VCINRIRLIQNSLARVVVNALQFLSRVSTLTRDIAILCVRPSVCP